MIVGVYQTFQKRGLYLHSFDPVFAAINLDPSHSASLTY